MGQRFLWADNEITHPDSGRRPWRRTFIFANGKNANKSLCPCQKKTLILIQSESFSTKSFLSDGINPTQWDEITS